MDVGVSLPEVQDQTAGEAELTSLVELILIASECSEDEGEVRDLVDSFYYGESLVPWNSREDRIANV